MTVLSVIRNLNLFKSLITGKTSYSNSTSLLVGLTRCLLLWLIIIYTPWPSCPYLYDKSFRFFSLRFRQPPTLPHRHQCSTIGRLGLNHRVRDGNGCYPQAHRHRKVCVLFFYACATLTHSSKISDFLRYHSSRLYFFIFATLQVLLRLLF